MADVAAPVFKKRVNKASNLRKRPATPPPDESASDSDYTDDDAGVRIKRRKRDGLTATNTGSTPARDLSRSSTFAADRSKIISMNDDATKTSNWYTDAALAAKESAAATHGVKPAPSPADDAAKGGSADGTYRGTAKYSTFIQKSADAPPRAVGPVKAPTNVRAITVTDFAPDVCKDYKQTGFCGFGDSCKFLHMREDYKQGWQLDKEWESGGAGKKSKGKPGSGEPAAASNDDGNEEEKLLRDIPFACVICKQPYTAPIVTKCGHYFCEACAMRRYMKEKKKTCAACGVDTGGSFGVARKLKGLLEKKRKRMDERGEADQAQEAGGGGGGK